MTGRSYDDAYLQPLVDRIIAGETIADIMRETGIARNTIAVAVGRLAGKRPPLRPKASPPESAADVARRHISHHSHTVLAVPDLHCPFQHPDALGFLKAARDKYQPNTVVFLGDEADFHAFSRYTPDPDGLSPGGELAKTIDALTPFYIEFPKAFVCESNHTVRPLKKMFESGLPAAFLPTYSKMLNAPDGWQWKPFWNIDGVRYHHGDAGRSGQFATAQYIKLFKQSHVHGHLHSHACVMYEGPYFGVNSGCLIDPTAYAFKYARNAPIPVSLGCSIIFGGRRATFVPMLTDADGRWVGYL